MASMFSNSLQSTILTLLLSKLPLHPLDIPQQSSFTLTGNSGPSLHLTDITLDIDKLQSQYFPHNTPVNIRHAFVENLKINITTTGIQIFIDGINCVVSPKATTENRESIDPNSSILLKSLDDPLEGIEGMVESVVGFVDAVSGVNSFLGDSSNNGEWNDEVTDTDNEDEGENEETKEEFSKFDKTTKALKELMNNDNLSNKDRQKNAGSSTKNNSLVSYAVDYLMDKIQVSLNGLVIKIIADPIISHLKIAKIDADGSKKDRKCTIEGIQVGFKRQKINSETPMTNDTEKSYYEDNSSVNGLDESDSHSDPDTDDNLMSSSLMVENREEFYKSMKETATNLGSTKSIYMSAAGDSFYDAASRITNSLEATKNTNYNDDEEDLLMVIDIIKLSFKERQSLVIEIGDIKISLVSLPTLLSKFITLLIQIRKQRFPVNNQRIDIKKHQKTGSKIVLETFCIDEISISLNSLLLPTGVFETSDSIRLNCSKFSLEQRSSILIQGSLQRVQILSKNKKSIYFDESKLTQPDIRIEFQTDDSSHITNIIAEKDLLFDIDYDLVQDSLGFYKVLLPALEKYEELKSFMLKKAWSNKYSSRSLRLPINTSANKIEPRTIHKKSELSLRMHSIRGKIGVSDKITEHLSFCISPFNFFSNQWFALDLVQLTLENHLGKSSLDINDISCYFASDDIQKTKHYDNISQKEVEYNCKTIFKIKNVCFHTPYEIFLKNLDILKALLLLLPKSEKPNKSVRFSGPGNHQLGSSSHYFQKKVVDFNIALEKLSFSILNVNEEFGDILGDFSGVLASSFSEDSKEASIKEISIRRVKKNLKESILCGANQWVTPPMLCLKFQKSLHLFLNNWMLQYSGKWLSMFADEETFDKYEPHTSNGDKMLENMTKKAKRVSVFDVYTSMTDVCLLLRPVSLRSEAALIIGKGNSSTSVYSDQTSATHLTFNTVSLLLIDDFENIIGSSKTGSSSGDWSLISILKNKGYTSIGSLTTILTKINIGTMETLKDVKIKNSAPLVDVQMSVSSIDLGVCCDSLQCFLQLIKDLKKPVSFSHDDKYKERTGEKDILSEIELDFFVSSFKDSTASCKKEEISNGSRIDSGNDYSEKLNFVENFYDNVEEYSGSSSQNDQVSMKRSSTENFSFDSNHFNFTHLQTSKDIIPLSFHISISEGNISLFDGYDWKETRLQIENALKRVSKKAKESFQERGSSNSDISRARRNDTPVDMHPVEETLYQSILLGIDPRSEESDVYRKISRNINGVANNRSDRETSDRNQTISLGKNKNRSLTLKRSLKNKVSINLEDIDISFNLLSDNEPHMRDKPEVFAKEGLDDSECVNQIDITINNLVIIDNVPSSSWNMFAGYLREAGEREIGKNMVKISIDLLRPVSRLAAMEMIMHVNILPLRLYVDQDTLDFLTRFGEFKDQRFIPPIIDNEEMFLQKLVIDTVKLKLDYKPKQVDYVGLRSGRTGEFVNFFVLDGADIVLNKVKLYGISGFSKLSDILNGFWSPDVKKNQLAGVLSGLAPVRSIINIGSGVNSLVTVPMNEYKKDGRILRSVQAGAVTFSKVTSGEVLKLGAKLAAGTQTILENTEQALGGIGSSARVVDNSATNYRLDEDSRHTSSSRKGSNRRRSSAASFGDEGEEDYQRYFLNKSINIIKQGESSQLVNELALGFSSNLEEDNENAVVDDDDEYDQNNFDYKYSSGSSLPNKKRSNYKNEESYVVSLYSNQPKSFNEGLRVAYGSIQSNFNTAKNAIYEAGIRASEADTITGAAFELAKATPVVFIRPVVATTEAISKGLLGAVNTINPEEGIKSAEKYKKHETSNDL